MDGDRLVPLEADRKAFEAQLPELLKAHAGKFALFKSGVLVGAFDSMESAYEAGLKQFGLDRFYIARVVTKPPPEQVPALMLGVLRACV